MWSKQQADNTTNPTTRTNNSNKTNNMTSFRNKISNKKRKNSAVPAVDVKQTTTDQNDEKLSSKQQQTKSSGGKNRNRNRNKKDIDIAVIDSDTKKIQKDIDNGDVILRNATQQDLAASRNNNVIKRYSDSFVIDNNVVPSTEIKIIEEATSVVPPVPALTRAVSGFFILDQARKARRFSDLFRPSTMKLSNSVENLKINNERNSIHLKQDIEKKQDKKKKKNNSDAAAEAADKKQETKLAEAAKVKQQSKKLEKKSTTPIVTKKEVIKDNSNNTDSYLRRVKSKIYKTKSDTQTNNNTNDTSSDTNNKSKKYTKNKKNLGSLINGSRIPEDEVAILTPNGVGKSLTHLDSRLIRQTSNLERGKPKTATLLTTTQHRSIDETDNNNTNKPLLLTKAKSSSSINLNMLRARRNKLMEQMFGGNTKDVQNEFEFIAFGSVNNVAGLGHHHHSHHHHHGKGVSSSSSVCDDSVFGSQRSLQKHPSWLHIHKEDEQEEKDDNDGDSNKADGKQGQPVSRSGSDRRPDAVREENSSKNHQQHQQDSLTGAAAAAMAAATAAAPSGCISSGGGGGADLQHLDATSALLLSERKQDNTSELSSSTILPATGSSRRVNSNINRSESVKEQSEKRKQRRNISDPSHNTTSGNADLDHHHTALSNTDSGSSSNSSISCNGRLSESPSNSVDVVGLSAPLRSVLDSDSDMDAEVEPWQNLVPPEALRNLPAHEKKRQDVINEFFHTEGSHVRNLKVLYKIFYKKIQESQTLKPDELSLVFPNIKEMLDIHTEINKEMRRRRKEDPIVKELGTMLLEIFDDGRGEQLKKAAATFCERQQLALEFIKRRRERDSKFDAVLTECEKKRQCRRLQLQGILPTEMQRLSKYPLLLERLIHSVESNKDSREQQQNNNSTTNTTDQALLLRQDEEEVTRLTRAYHLSKEILNYVNDAAKVAHNRHRLEEIQKHLDTSSFEKSEQPIAQEFKTIDLTKYRLIIEGGMTLRRPNKALVPVHILLLEEAVVILHREGDRFLLKFFQSGSTAQPSPLSPIIKMNTLLVRTNAVCKDALFLVSTSTNNSQMYDLIAEDEIKREVWFKHFSDATEAYSRREGKPLPSSKKSVGGAGSGHHDQQHHQQQQSVDSDDEEDDDDEDDNNQDAVANDESANEVAIDLPPQAAVAERRAAEVDGTKKELSAAASSTTSSTSPAGGGGDRAEEDESRASPEMVTGGGAQSTRVTAEDWPLIQPSQVSVAVPPVYIADAMLTPLEQIRRKDALVKQALADKESLVADMLSIPREDFHHIADMASMDTSQHRDPSERVLACIFQGDQLLKAVNQSLNINDLDVMTNKGGKHPTCASQNNVDNDSTSSTSMSSSSSSVPLTVPSVVRDIATSLNSQLTTLLSEVKQIEEERDRLRKELHRVRERLHEEHNLHSPGGGVVVLDDSENLTSSTSCTSDQSTLNDSIQVVNKSDCEEEQ